MHEWPNREQTLEILAEWDKEFGDDHDRLQIHDSRLEDNWTKMRGRWIPTPATQTFGWRVQL
jgi:hypothetical protein